MLIYKGDQNRQGRISVFVTRIEIHVLTLGHARGMALIPSRNSRLCPSLFDLSPIADDLANPVVLMEKYAMK